MKDFFAFGLAYAPLLTERTFSPTQVSTSTISRLVKWVPVRLPFVLRLTDATFSHKNLTLGPSTAFDPFIRQANEG